MADLLSRFHDFGTEIINAYHLQGFRVISEVDGEPPSTTILILEPMKLDRKYISVFKLWYRYYKQNFPDQKVIVLGFHAFNHPNYVNLYDFDGDFDRVIRNAQTNIAPEDFPQDGIDICQPISVFFEGHGQGTVISQLAVISTSCEVLYQVDEDQVIEFVPELDAAFDLVFKRWTKYDCYFRLTPFFKEIDRIRTSFLSVHSQIRNLNYVLKSDDRNIITELKKCSNSLRLIYNRYIKPETSVENPHT